MLVSLFGYGEIVLSFTELEKWQKSRSSAPKLALNPEPLSAEIHYEC